MRAEAHISLGALIENYRLFLSRARAERKDSRLFCVVKSNAYGHGLVPCAKALYQAGARHFAVAELDEAVALKKHLPDGEVLVFGKTDPKEANALHQLGILQSIHSFSYAKSLSEATDGTLRVHVKIDVGMGRMGIPAEDIEQATKEILATHALPNIQLEGIFAHLPEADCPNSTKTPYQIEKFQTVLRILRSEGLDLTSHLSATAGLLRFGLAGCQMARVGIGLWGISPSPLVSAPILQPVLTLTCPLLQVKTVQKGQSVGYGGGWIAPEAGNIGIIPFGYADGLPRLAEGGRVFVWGHSVPIVGRISMDYATLWLGSIPATEGDLVTVYDKKAKNLLALSAQAQTIPYELLATLAPRVKRVYTK